MPLLCATAAAAPRDSWPSAPRSYVARVLDTPLNWGVHSTALLVKSWLEFESHRTAERAVLQMQVRDRRGH